MNRSRNKRQKYKYHTRKAYKHKKHANIRKSAKNKQPSNLLFKTVKLYKRQKNKYLDKATIKPIRVKKQKGGKTSEELKEESDIRTANFEKKDKERRKFASEQQVLNRLKRNLKTNNVSSKIYQNPAMLEILFTFNIFTFEDLVGKNNATLDNIMVKMNLNSVEKDKLLKVINDYKTKSTNNNDKVDSKQKKQQKLVRELQPLLSY